MSMIFWLYGEVCGLRSSFPRKNKTAILKLTNLMKPLAFDLICRISEFNPSVEAGIFKKGLCAGASLHRAVGGGGFGFHYSVGSQGERWSLRLRGNTGVLDTQLERPTFGDIWQSRCGSERTLRTPIRNRPNAHGKRHSHLEEFTPRPRERTPPRLNYLPAFRQVP
jgi:hypothetical protein